MVDIERELDRAHVHVRHLVRVRARVRVRVRVRARARVRVPMFKYGTWSVGCAGVCGRVWAVRARALRSNPTLLTEPYATRPTYATYSLPPRY